MREKHSKLEKIIKRCVIAASVVDAYFIKFNNNNNNNNSSSTEPLLYGEAYGITADRPLYVQWAGYGE